MLIEYVNKKISLLLQESSLRSLKLSIRIPCFFKNSILVILASHIAKFTHNVHTPFFFQEFSCFFLAISIYFVNISSRNTKYISITHPQILLQSCRNFCYNQINNALYLYLLNDKDYL